MANTPAKRPSVKRKPTRRSEQNRQAEMDQGIAINVNGKRYEVQMGDLTAADAQIFRREMGMSFMKTMQLDPEDFDLDVIAGIVWLARRKDGEVNLRLSEVASEIGYDTEIEPVQMDDDSDKKVVVDGEVMEEGDPEGSGGTS